MRRLTRLRPASGLLSQAQPPTASMASSVRCIAGQGSAASTTITGSNSFSTSQPRSLQRSAVAWQKDTISTQSTGIDAETIVVKSAAARMTREPKLVLPPVPEWAPWPEDVPDPSYKPATSAQGLEEVGGLEGWWEKDEHWNGMAPAFTPFYAGNEKVWDAKLLEGIARRAVVEALVVRESAEQGLEVPRTWALGGKDAAVRALSLKVEVDGQREAKIVDEAEAKMVLKDLIGSAKRSTNNKAGASDLAVDEVTEILNTVGSHWKAIGVADFSFKFSIMKRIQQLSGHILTDHKYWGIGHVDSLVQMLVKKPRPAKLADELKLNTQLQQLPNVAVHDRRQTPIDKHKAVGRWKVIERELKKRDLPVLGDGEYGRSVEKSWMRGGT